MIRTKPSSDATQIAAAALKLAGAKGWESLTIEAVAKAARIPAPVLKKRFVSLCDLIPLIAAEIDREAFATFGKLSGTPHDRLFDSLMARFDILQKHRKAILGMASAARTDRSLSCALGRATLDGVYRIIDVTGITTPPRPALAAGIGAIYAYAFFVWSKDTSRDMAKTMAALDRGLRLAGKATDFLKKR